MPFLCLPSTGTLLELNYDACHVADWRVRHDETKKRIPERKGEFKVFESVIQGHRRRTNQRIQLPARVQAIMRKPADEKSWTKLEQLRRVIVAEVECERELHFTKAELELLAASIRTNRSHQKTFPDEVGRYTRSDSLHPVPKGSRVLLRNGTSGSKAAVLDLLSITREYEPLRIKLRPAGTKREQTLDDFGTTIRDSTESIQEISATQHISQEECLDRMLLVLWDALMLNMCEVWTRGNVANLHVCEAPQLARYFCLGLQVGSNPLFDGVCAMCGALLYGSYKGTHTNKYNGPPSDRDGNIIRDASAQPPFLLRYSPELYAKEAPAWFEHDLSTNRLSLKPGVAKPWMRQGTSGAERDDSKAWLYCIDCKDRYFHDPGKRGIHSHISYRDRASTHLMKPVRKRRCGRELSRHQDGRPLDEQEHQPPQQEEQEMQPQQSGIRPNGEDIDVGDDADTFGGPEDELQPPADMDSGDDEDEGRRQTRFERGGYVPNLPDAPVTRPTLAEYQARWAAELAKYAREVPGAFSRHNLVPKPIHELWQDAPHVPFGNLRSTEAQARLSVCRSRSALEEPNARSGVGRYAHLTGDAMHTRRAPQQLNSMLGFVLNQKGVMALLIELNNALYVKFLLSFVN